MYAYIRLLPFQCICLLLFIFSPYYICSYRYSPSFFSNASLFLVLVIKNATIVISTISCRTGVTAEQLNTHSGWDVPAAEAVVVVVIAAVNAHGFLCSLFCPLRLVSSVTALVSAGCQLATQILGRY